AEMRAFEHSEVHRYSAEMPHRADLSVFEPREQPALIEYLRCPSRKADPTRFPAPCFPTLEDDDIGAAEAQFAGQHQSYGPGTDDYDVGIFDISAYFGSRVHLPSLTAIRPVPSLTAIRPAAPQ